MGGTRAIGAIGLADFGGTLSSSSTDPFVNIGPASADTLALYLWFYCSRDTAGLSSAYLGCSCNSTTMLVDFDARPGAVVDSVAIGCGYYLSFSDCPRGSFVVADMVYAPTIPGFDICIEYTPQGPSQTFSCETPTVGEPQAWIGYTTRAKPEPCSENFVFFQLCTPVTPVTTSSWGRTKALYAP
jgi:hypothetical protein